MRQLFTITCLTFATTGALGNTTPKFETLTEVAVKKPAFVFVDQPTQDNEPNLLVTSFSPFFGGHRVSLFKNLDTLVSGGIVSESQSILTTQSVWPNEAKRAPANIFGENYFIVSGGFLVPGNDKGAIDLVHKENGKVRTLTTPKSGWFYHRSIFVDMNNDGKLDILTARAKKSFFGSGGEMLWLEQPDNITDQWNEHMILRGPDVHFRVHDFDNDGVIEIVATQFFSKKLSYHWFQDGSWQTKVIDDTLGSAYDVEINDLNMDGKADLLVTNHEKNKDAAVFAYLQPEDLSDGKWERKTLLSGIETRNGGLNPASPGEAFSFYPNESRKLKPWIIVAGDGSQRAHLLTPKSQASEDWEYVHHELADAKGTVGKISVVDINGDGWVEAFIPAYDKDKIIVVGFKP